MSIKLLIFIIIPSLSSALSSQNQSFCGSQSPARPVVEMKINSNLKNISKKNTKINKHQKRLNLSGKKQRKSIKDDHLWLIQSKRWDFAEKKQEKSCREWRARGEQRKGGNRENGEKEDLFFIFIFIYIYY